MVWNVNSQWKAMVHREGDAIPGKVNMIRGRLGCIEGNDFVKTVGARSLKCGSIILRPSVDNNRCMLTPVHRCVPMMVAADGIGDARQGDETGCSGSNPRICSSTATTAINKARQFAVSNLLAD